MHHQPCSCAAGRAAEEEGAAAVHHVDLSILRHPKNNISTQEQEDEQKGEVISAIIAILNFTCLQAFVHSRNEEAQHRRGRPP